MGEPARTANEDPGEAEDDEGGSGTVPPYDGEANDPRIPDTPAEAAARAADCAAAVGPPGGDVEQARRPEATDPAASLDRDDCEPRPPEREGCGTSKAEVDRPAEAKSAARPLPLPP